MFWVAGDWHVGYSQRSLETETGKYYRVSYAPAKLKPFPLLATLYKDYSTKAWKMHRIPELEGGCVKL